MDQPRNHPAPKFLMVTNLDGRGLRWHSTTSVVGVPRGSYGWRVVTPPRIWCCGIRNAAHSPC